MKKTIFTLSILAFAATGVFAQGKQLVPVQQKAGKVVKQSAVQAKENAPKTTISFKTLEYDFGTIQQGDPAEAEFTLKNTGKEPLIIQSVHPSCGCTTPYWSKEPVAPGKKGVIKAAYDTHRIGAFNKTITVNSTAGTTVLRIKGVVKKAPEASAPQNTSMIKTK